MIYTLTANPAIDYNIACDGLAANTVTRTRNAVYTPNGKGLNVSFTLDYYGVDTTILGFFAGFSGEFIVKGAEALGVPVKPVWTDGITRVNVFLNAGPDTEYNMVNAGAALLDTCKEVKGKDPVQIGSYRGFTMSVAFDSMWKTYTLTLKGRMTHRVELGSDARGNLVRIENALDKMPERLRSVQEQLENLYNQQAAAKAEVGKPFPQEQELAAKTARLIELDMELNLDGKGQPQPEQAIAKSARPSVLDRLKASPVHGAPEKPHKKEMEAR